VETHVQTLARLQASQGWSARVICVNHASRSGQDVTWSRHGATVSREERDGPVEVHRIGRSAHVARFDVCPDLVRTIKAITPETTDLVHLHAPNPLMAMGVATMLRAEVPVVVTHHSDIVRQRVLRYAVEPFHHAVYQRADRIVVSTERYWQTSRQLTPYAEKVEVVPLGIDLRRFAEPGRAVETRAAELRAEHGSPLWLTVGRCVYYKGLATAIRAMPGVPGKLMVIGTGPEEIPLRQLAGRLGVASRLIWRSHVEQSELLACYRAATALWFPSNARSEAYGLVQVEAMAAGCPVINTAIAGNGVAWVSRDGDTGLTVPVDDPTALAAAARRLCDDPSLHRRLATRSRERAASEFSGTLMAERVLAVYDHVLDQRNPRLRSSRQARLAAWVHERSVPGLVGD
jgi:rhamnosyl/mannosyltransferase